MGYAIYRYFIGYVDTINTEYIQVLPYKHKLNLLDIGISF